MLPEPRTETAEAYGWLRYIAPFAVFLLMLAASGSVPVSVEWEGPVRVLLLGALSVLCWPRHIPIRPRYLLASTTIGILAFFLWIAPEAVFSGYRNLGLFSNSIIGHVHSSLSAAEIHDPWVLAWRAARAVLIVPIVEELFWRGWLMRWLIDSRNFQSVPLGAFSWTSFWIVAVLFASEHGSFWDVGLLAGIVYNWWMIRTRNLWDCIIAHAVTNGILAAYVIGAGQWQYWL